MKTKIVTLQENMQNQLLDFPRIPNRGPMAKWIKFNIAI